MTHLLKTYPTLPIDLDRGEGVYVYDTKGNRYLDMYAGHAVTSTGHCHPTVVKAIQEQTGKLLFFSNAIGIPIREEAAGKLLSQAPEGFSKVFFANSGAEANESALKLARRYTRRTNIVSTIGGFHGRTAGAVSVAGIKKYRDQAAPLVPGVTFVAFGELKDAIDKETAAIILEPIQSMAGVKTAPAAYFQGLRKLCDDKGTLLIYDEVQTGMGRVGSMFFAGQHGVVPDLITLAKGIASGFPMSAMLVQNRIAETVEYAEFGATFGAGPVAMAALKATIEVIENENLLDNVKSTGALLKNELQNVPGVKEVRGIGFLVGVKTEFESQKLSKALLDKGVIVGGSMEPDVLRLLPPLTLKPEHVKEFITAFKDVLAHELQGSTLR